jgi:hypothetical protein
VYVYRRDRDRIETEARYIPEVQSYVVEICNEGRRPVTINAAGVSVYPEGYGNQSPAEVTLAQDQLPARLLEGDSLYVGITASYNPKHILWIRDAHGHRTIHLISPPLDETDESDRRRWRDLTVTERAELFSRPVERDRIAALKRQLSVIEAQVELVRIRAEYEERRRTEKESTKGK